MKTRRVQVLPVLPVAILAVWVVLVTGTGAVAAEEGDSMSEKTPVLLFVQGKLKPDGAEIYQQYVAGTGPLIAEYGAEVTAVGSAIASDHTTDVWPINAVLEFPDREAAEGFLGDPRYLELKKHYRDHAYETLHLTMVESRTPRVRTVKNVAEEAFADFRQGLATGAWQPFLARLTDDFTFRFPMGRYQGEHHGKDKATEFFAYVSQVYAKGLMIDEVERVTAEDNRVVFEFRDHGEMRGQLYNNIVAISLDIRGEKVCAYREYFGLVGPPPTEKKP